MPPKGLQSTRKAALQLQTINKLRIRSPNQQEQNPCLTIMSSMLKKEEEAKEEENDPRACAGLEEQLRACTDKKVALHPPSDGDGCCVVYWLEAGIETQNNHTSPINYHLMRMFPKISGPRKRKGRLG
ncbi:hypothetical protein KEM52_005923 [Ascosphaera acerosa]|nr:hypothetical protein KEM52_005923 [Ascosphaera acerosa]